MESCRFVGGNYLATVLSTAPTPANGRKIELCVLRELQTKQTSPTWQS
jgi:hypothetical protein